MPGFENTVQLEERLTRPLPSDVDFLRRLEGDLIVLGASGKMGPTLVRRIRRAADEAGKACRVIACSRTPPDCGEGVESVACDLMEPAEVARLPRVRNVVYMAGRKFGSTGNAELTWAANTVVPANVARHFRDSRIVVFSTGNVYPFVAAKSGGSVESDDPAPVGEYAQSCLGRERVFEYYSRRFGTPCLFFRLNYAVDLLYGVLVDIARQVWENRPVDLSVPAVNAIWQGDANSYALRSLDLCASPPRVLNVTGPGIYQVRETAEYFAARFGRQLEFTGESAGSALLSNSEACRAALGEPEISASQLLEWVACWVESGGASINKATHFQVTDGKF